MGRTQEGGALTGPVPCTIMEGLIVEAQVDLGPQDRLDFAR